MKPLDFKPTQRDRAPPSNLIGLLQPDDLDLEVLLKSRALHTDGIFTEASIFAYIRAKTAGIPVIEDTGTLRDGMLDIARLSDCFIASETFSQAMAEDPVETCLKLSRLGCCFVGVTLGAKGYITMIDGRVIKTRLSGKGD